MTNQTPTSIKEYLELLKEAMTGADPAVINDALYDAEEHLRAEMSQNPGKTEAEVLEPMVNSYGSPEEVAALYLETEEQVNKAMRPPPRRKKEGKIANFFAVLTDPTAYTALFYMFLSLATGIIYFTVVVTGFSITAPLIVLIIGIPLFWLFLATIRTLALVEGRIVETLLGVRMPRRPVYINQDKSVWNKIIYVITDAKTWTSMLYMVIHLALGIIYFTIAVTGISTVISFILAPFSALFSGDTILFVSGLPILFSPLFSAIGIILLTALLHLVKWIGQLQAQIAKGLLVKFVD